MYPRNVNDINPGQHKDNGNMTSLEADVDVMKGEGETLTKGATRAEI